jgi:hypothetical protein
MKYAIHCQNDRIKWIAALANTKEKAEAYLAKIKEEVQSEIIPIEVNKFPVFRPYRFRSAKLS